MTTLDFLKEGIKNMKTVGTVMRTSPKISQMMVEEAKIKEAKNIVELGAGDGAITKHILKQMKPDARLIVFEVNPSFCKSLQKIKDSRLIIIQDSAENLESHLFKYDIDHVDSIISAIPFVVLSNPLTSQILNICKKILISGGLFVQIHYSLIIKNLYEQIFGNLRIEFKAFNIPPTFIFVCKK
ncbi:MAG: methyltransferase [Bacteroidota bacterium]|nr:methyltransferase [Bacteroidota bacterium]